MSARSGCTAAVRAGIDSDRAFGAVIPPLHLSSTFSFAGYADKRRYDYTRSGNPTRDLLGEAPTFSGAFLAIDRGRAAELDARLADQQQRLGGRHGNGQVRRR